MDFASGESPPTKRSDGKHNSNNNNSSNGKFELSAGGPPRSDPPAAAGGPPSAVNSNFNNNESRYCSPETVGGRGLIRHSRSVNGVVGAGERHRLSSDSYCLKELESARDWSHDQPVVEGIKDLGTPC